jgi:hypothetical protein
MDEIIEIIKADFDSMGWKYEVETHDERVLIKTVMEGKNEMIYICIRIFPAQNRYQILCMPDTTIAKEHIDGAIAAMNEFNLFSSTVCGSIGYEGNIVFWLGRHTNGGVSSTDAFDTDFRAVLLAADNETAQIYKKAHTARKASTKKLFSFFKR